MPMCACQLCNKYTEVGINTVRAGLQYIRTSISA